MDSSTTYIELPNSVSVRVLAAVYFINKWCLTQVIHPTKTTCHSRCASIQQLSMFVGTIMSTTTTTNYFYNEIFITKPIQKVVNEKFKFNEKWNHSGSNWSNVYSSNNLPVMPWTMLPIESLMAGRISSATVFQLSLRKLFIASLSSEFHQISRLNAPQLCRYWNQQKDLSLPSVRHCFSLFYQL